jgi:hypothetical protein
MFIAKLALVDSEAVSAQASEDEKLKAAFRAMYARVDDDRNGKVDFVEFAVWIVKSITGLDDFFLTFVSKQARYEKPPLYVKNVFFI